MRDGHFLAFCKAKESWNLQLGRADSEGLRVINVWPLRAVRAMDEDGSRGFFIRLKKSENTFMEYQFEARTQVRKKERKERRCFQFYRQKRNRKIECSLRY